MAFPDVDLVVAPNAPVRLTAQVQGDELFLEAFSQVALADSFEILGSDEIHTQGGERFRESSLSRRKLLVNGLEGEAEVLSVSRRRILAASELGRNCLTCGEEGCRDRPRETVLTELRRPVPR